MYIRPVTVAIAIAISSVAISHNGSAQTIGTLIGANISTLSETKGAVGEVVGAALNKKKRIGLKAGLYLKIPLAGMFSLQPEVFYAQNGVTYESTLGDGESFDLNLGYIEVPVLLRVDISPKSTIHPILMAGASGAYRVQCKFDAPSGASTASQKCDVSGASDDPIKKSDYSAVGGAGLAANLGGYTASLQLRYTQGLASISTDATDVAKPKNRALSVLLGFTF